MSEDYPKNEVCAKCGQQIVIHLSSKGNEYACNSEVRNDFHDSCGREEWKHTGGQRQIPLSSEMDEPLAEPQTAHELNAYQNLLIGLRVLLKKITEAVDQQIEENRK